LLEVLQNGAVVQRDIERMANKAKIGTAAQTRQPEIEGRIEGRI
jgi:hypothetical protein